MVGHCIEITTTLVPLPSFLSLSMSLSLSLSLRLSCRPTIATPALSLSPPPMRCHAHAVPLRRRVRCDAIRPCPPTYPPKEAVAFDHTHSHTQLPSETGCRRKNPAQPVCVCVCYLPICLYLCCIISHKVAHFVSPNHGSPDHANCNVFPMGIR
ncbi:hypothetical protein B0T19DRAFT_271747 [Cercophora scortea]|uniref:Uncharacterized protein n=1 Tax=Cercophora scortea TaxID=314031 RepID=A0AAE0I792_9PEZI|nr:hypothetical protein B0T19DRAFT_271747 [Cercophora scortea]